MDVGIDCIEMAGRNPVDVAPQVAFDLFHQCTGKPGQVLHFPDIIGRDHKAKLTDIAPRPRIECLRVGVIA